jgi:hypothetical protein
MTEPKLCKNCKHFRRDWITFLFEGDEYAKCSNPKSFALFCSNERKNFYSLGVCGPEAKNFEEKETKSFWEWLRK